MNRTIHISSTVLPEAGPESRALIDLEAGVASLRAALLDADLARIESQVSTLRELSAQLPRLTNPAILQTAIRIKDETRLLAAFLRRKRRHLEILRNALGGLSTVYSSPAERAGA